MFTRALAPTTFVLVATMFYSLALFGATGVGTTPATDQLQLLLTSREALQARVDLMFAEGSHQVDVSTFMIKEDQVGLGLLASAIYAVEHGGRARVAFDAYESELSPETIAYVTSKGVELKVFRPVIKDKTRPFATLKSMLGLNTRSHEKLFIVDGSSAVVGSSNLSEDYYLSARGRENRHRWQFKDREILVQGPGAADVKADFDRKWKSSGFKPAMSLVRAPLVAEKTEAIAKKIDELKASLVALHQQKPFTLTSVAADKPVEYAADATTLFAKNRNVHDKLIDLIDSATTELVIENPYVVLPKDMFNAIARATKRGVSVQLYTNKPGGGDSGDVDKATIPDMAQLSRLGVQIHFFEIGMVFHGKVMVADGARFFWGSYNLDNRSKMFNLENGFFFESRAIAKQLEERRKQEAFGERLFETNGQQLTAVRAARSCREIFSNEPGMQYNLKLSPTLRLKRPFL